MSSLATDPLVGLVEAEAQIEASAAFQAMRRRMREGALETVPLLVGGSVLQVGVLSLDVPLLGTVNVSSALLFDTGVYLVVVGMVLMVFEAFGERSGEEQA